MNNKIPNFIKWLFPSLIMMLIFGAGAKNILAQESTSVLYVPLIGITSVPKPMTLTNGPADVTYSYAVKNFLREAALTNVKVVDDNCSPVKFTEGDDNRNSKLDYTETWRYTCTTTLSKTTQSTATVTAIANYITATHKAYATVVVGSDNPAPLISIINVTQITYPLSLPKDGGEITFTYKVNNPGNVPLSDVTVTDDKCKEMSTKLGDTNGNNLLDTNEVWIFTCRMNLTQTTTSNTKVSAFANGLEATGNATIIIKVEIPVTSTSPTFPKTGGNDNLKINAWEVLVGILIVLLFIFFLTRRINKTQKKSKSFRHK